MKKEKIYIVPDVHGRIFWKKLKRKARFNKIVFLGDYLDPYPHEFTTGDVDKERKRAIDNFQEIIELKRKYPENVTLLIGNHDCTYAVSKEVCDCRRDKANFETIKSIFDENKELFQICKCVDVGGTVYLLSHAGVHLNAFGEVFEYEDDPFALESLLNSLYATRDHLFLNVYLPTLSFYRGGYHTYGSVVWADVREWRSDEDNAPFKQIFGHTQLSQDGSCINIADKYYCIDSRECFELDKDGLRPVK